MKFLLGFWLLGLTSYVVNGQRRFPDDFIFGTATAAYQIEGGWNADGKGENIWDRLTHTRPELIKDGSSGDVTSDSYNNWQRDVEMMRELGLDAYRFSLSWSRILPTGFANKINEAGVTYYNNLIDEMLKYNITPLVTLYHWDLPQPLLGLGGFTNAAFPVWYEDYARVVFETFGDRVKFWITFNEPREICNEGYGHATKAPALNATGIGDYMCAKNLLLAHAHGYRLYNEEFKSVQHGECGITISMQWYDAATDSADDLFAAELRRQAEWGIYAEPIFSKTGGFPKEFAERVAQKSAEQGYPRSRLPELSAEEIEYIKGTADFFGINHYSGTKVSATIGLSTSNPVPSMADDINVGADNPDWVVSALSWLRLVPGSLYEVLSYANEKYDAPTFYITENGWASFPNATLEDDDRITYYRSAFESLLDALDAGIDLRGYMAWTLLDNYEWFEGYSVCFGLYQTDFNSTERTRTPRKSAFVYKHLIQNRYIDYEYNPVAGESEMTIDQ